MTIIFRRRAKRKRFQSEYEAFNIRTDTYSGD